MNLFLKVVSISSVLLLSTFLYPGQLIGAPRVSLSLDKNRISPQKTFTCELTISWEGDADQYLVDRPHLTFPEGITEVGSSSSSISTGNRYTLRYRYALRAEKEGTYLLKPAAISYWAKGNNAEEQASTEELTIPVTSFSLLKYGRNWLVPVVLTIILISLFGALIVVTSRKRRRNRHQKHTTSLKDALEKDLTCCSNFKIKGDWESYIQTALDIRNKLPMDVKGLEALDRLAENIRYGGFRPTTEEINLIHRQLEQAVKNAFTHNQDNELDGIALRQTSFSGQGRKG
jgi:hypothetical protein